VIEHDALHNGTSAFIALYAQLADYFCVEEVRLSEKA
jgi:hypothetical protein